MRFLAPLLASAVALAAPPALRAQTPAVSLTPAERSGYAQAFAAIRAGDWAGAAAALDALPAGGALMPVARAELYTARGAPLPDPATLTALLASAPDLPEAPALAQSARSLGATVLPPLPAMHDLYRVPGASKRRTALPGRSDAAARDLAAQVQPLLKAKDCISAEPLVEAAAATLAPEALTEWRARLAWGYFQADDTAAARRVAAVARTGPGEWAVQAAWTQGLAAWRAGAYAEAADAFAAVGTNGSDAETRAAGQFWAARAFTADGHPEQVAARLRAASRTGETFYGLLASAALGLPAAAVPAATPTESVLARPNVRAAAALAQLGEKTLADQLLRQQAKIGPAAEHLALVAVAGQLGLPATQLWLAQNAPAGSTSSPLQRFPMPAWSPAGGWRVDRALLYAHALQESQFRTDAVSRTGARGLMQLMPGTARLVARHKGDSPDVGDRLTDPALNFEYGQSYLEELAGHAGTGGLLPKVIAAYNAGPNNVALWNLLPQVQQDPLLFIESIPFAETRAYTAIVLRNYWMYQRETGADTPSLAALTQRRWPLFPRRATQAAVAAPVRNADAGEAGLGGGN